MKTLFKYISPYKGLLILVFLLVFVQSSAGLLIPTLTAKLVNVGVLNHDTGYIMKTGTFMLGAALAAAGSAAAAAWFSSKVSAYAARDLRIQVFSNALTASTDDFDRIGTSSMITRCTGDIIQIQQAVLMTLQFILPAPVLAVMGMVLAFSKDRVLSLLLLGVIVIFAVYSIYIGRRMVPLTRKMQIKMDHINRVILENLSGVRVIRAFSRMGFQKQKFDKTAADYAHTAIKLNKAFALAVPLVMLIMNLTIVLILWFGGVRISHSPIQIGDIMAFVEYAVLILSGLNMGIMAVIYIFRAKACMSRIQEILKLKQPQQESESRTILTGSDKTVLEFHDVSFGYTNAEKPVLEHISFQVRTGEVMAVIGGTGSGKSTLAKMITGFHDVLSGSVRLNGIDRARIPLKELRDKVGYVPQKTFLFSGTIEENIRYGKKDADCGEVERAARTAQAHDFISAMPDGYLSRVAQSGQNYSGGQKQRLAIARALVKQPDIYIFDDSFSALDYQTEAKLRKALREETGRAIVFITAQRVSTIMDADKILVLDDGKVAGLGTHNELLKSCSLYREIAKSQSAEKGMGT